MITSWLTVSLATTMSLQDPGTCRCNAGCHHFADQCVHQNDCAPGFVPSCPIRDGDDPTCPHDVDVSCDHECTCIPGPPGDAGGGGGGSDGGGKADGGGQSDGGGNGNDGGACNDGGGGGGDAGKRSDSGASNDAGSGGGTDAGSGGSADAASSGCDCPDGYECIGTDHFCAGPCGANSTCPSGYTCSAGHCIPDCILVPCPSPLECDYANGQCVNAHPDAGTNTTDASSSGGGDDGPSGGGSASQDDAGGTSDGLGDNAGDGAAGDDHGCGCTTVGERSAGGFAAIAGLLGLALAARRRHPRARS